MSLLTALGIACAAYAVIHSILADDGIMGRVYHAWWYRFFYVVSSAVLLLPVLYLYWVAPSAPVYHPAGAARYILLAGWIFGLGFMLYAAKSYDNGYFFGLKQMKTRSTESTPPALVRTGALGVVRHPYYFGGLLLLLSRPQDERDVVVSAVFSIYFVLGSLNEERKLLKVYGDAYREYQKDVPMLFPLKLFGGTKRENR